MYDHDFTKDQFKALWPNGYWESFGEGGYTPSVFTDVCDAIRPFMHRGHVALELGPGRGRWTSLLAASFKRVIALDVIPRPPGLAELDNLEYVELADRDFSCTGVASSSIDFVFSFGLFCHLSNEACAAYLKSLYRVMRPGAKLVAMFANWERHLGLDADAVEYMNRPNPTDWFYCNWKLVNLMALEAGFVKRLDLMPKFRDALLYAEKP